MAAKSFYYHDPKGQPEKIKEWTVSSNLSVQYPSTWFKENKAKPPLNVIKKRDITTLRRYMCDQMGKDTMKPAYVVAYILEVFAEAPSTLERDWESFSIKIGEKGKPVKLHDLMTLIEDEKADDLVIPDNSANHLEDVAYLTYVCSMYRLNMCNNESYKVDLADRMTTVLQSMKVTDHNLLTESLEYLPWMSYVPYCRMMAFLDMYLTEFPTHKYVKCKIGTVTTRFKDCTVLQALVPILATLNIEISEFARWIWTPKCAKQFVDMIRNSSEMDQDNSYAMYFMEMGLARKSPYSAPHNPELHFFLHCVGTLFLNHRSKNARSVAPVNFNLLLNNAIWIKRAYNRIQGFKTYFTETEQPVIDYDDKSGGDADDEPHTLDPLDWYAYVTGLRFKMPDEIVLDTLHPCSALENIRQDTVGYILQSIFQSMNYRNK